MALSIFDDKSKQPTEQMLAKAIGKQYQLWTDIAEYVVEKYLRKPFLQIPAHLEKNNYLAD
jgi:hypothetical protein